MDGIPPPLPGDPEEVAWALGTAETLWKRGDRVDAVVWVRRAAAAADDCDEEQRALELRSAASSLSVFIGSTTARPPGESERPPKVATEALDALLSDPGPVRSREGSEVFTLSVNDVELVSSRKADTASVFPDLEIVEEHITNLPSAFPEEEEETPIRRVSRSPSPPNVAPVAPPPKPAKLDPWAAEERGTGRRRAPLIPREETDDDGDRATLTFEDEELVTSAKRPAIPAPPAPRREEPVRAPVAPQVPTRPGRAPLPEEPDTRTYRQVSPRADLSPPPTRLPSMGPLARPRSVAPKPTISVKPPAPDSEAPTKRRAMPSAPPPTRSAPPELDLLEMIDSVSSEDLVVTSRASTAPPPLPAAARPSVPAKPAAPAISSRPTALPPRATNSLPEGALPTAPPPSSGAPTAPPQDAPQERPSGLTTAIPPAASVPPPTMASPSDHPALQPVPAPPPEASPAVRLDLDAVEALGDLPDDAREAFARAAVLHSIARNEEVSNFALALVVAGEIDVSATIVDAPAMRLAKGSVLRSRGSVVPGVPLRLVCASDDAVVATWGDAAVEEAFRICPWVEEDLRAVADAVQTQAGVTMGPLGERFDESLRSHITKKLVLRKLAPGESLVAKGKPTPLAIVGVGEIVTTKDGARGTTFRSGDFVFPSEVLIHAPAPAEATAGPSGAVVLFGDRAVAQELLMSFPPILEVLASI